ncbi:MAG TPA: hypothetical protein PK036_14475 [Geobacteraceae bacterium]|nr:hypothetical protein [Geobacteraceae bacterium]
MTTEAEERIIELLEEQNRLLTILVGPVVSLRSEQLAKMTPEERRQHSKAALARAKEKYGRGHNTRSKK